MFERTLQDLIRGLRSHKGASKAQEDAFIAEAMTEIRDELKGKDMALKAEAIIKMCYLMMLYPIAPPAGFAFHVVEVMSSPRYHLKQLGYLAAPMAFSGDTEETVLTVNGIKKDLLSPHVPLPPLPLTALPHLLSLSPSLSTSLHPDILHLLTHSSPRIRKRAVLCLLPCWEAFPEGLREGFSRLRERLQDEDQGVVGATVGVVMELARRQGGKNYLPLAPELFGILTGSSNNWMLIKVVKLFAILTPLEPRLVRKLLPPITTLISNTSAISLLYECVRTCIVGGMLDPDRQEADALARVCVEKLGGYLKDEGGDQNPMVKIIPTHPHLVAEYQDEVLQSLDDPDVSIRMRALELATNMVDPNNLQTIADTLLSHLAPSPPVLSSAAASLAAIASSSGTSSNTPPSLSPAYRHLLSTRLLAIISQDTYANVTDFEWVLSVLVDIAYVARVDVGQDIKKMVLDVVARVKSVRNYAVSVLEKVLRDDDLREKIGDDNESADGLIEAAVWVCGEYPSELSSPLSVISNLLSPSTSTTITSLSVQAVAKIFGYYCTIAASSWSGDKFEEIKALVASIDRGLAEVERDAKGDMEVLERIGEIKGLLGFVKADLEHHVPPQSMIRRDSESSIPELEGGFEAEAKQTNQDEPPYPKSLYIFPPLSTSHPLNAVASYAQSSIPVPDGLDLDTDLVPGGGWPEDIEEVDESEEEREKDGLDLGEGGGEGMEELRRVMREGRKKKKGKKGEEGEDKVEKMRRKAARRAKHKDDPYYLYDKEDEDVDNIPIVKLDDSELPDPSSRSKSKLKQKKKAPPEFDRTGELPEGVFASQIPTPPSRLRQSASRMNSTTGLAAVDLSTSGSLSKPISRSSSHFEEYKLDEEEGLSGETSQVSIERNGGEDVPVASVPEVQVVKVKRKKKPGEKKKKKEEKKESPAE
ncbi:AP-3 complex subunit delta-1 [Cryptococcus gattii E566]|uniref:AP-3 complex subunit delta n=2 Tax=Cryptococcus gattii TaxID=37769 RepID=E6R6J2_CRYGW|nr:Delta adaptin-like subunit of the clathrin associated protein complex (AP-3), putative; Apl5p [Cryptococcus gattii WM276]ADV22388.1 Delta adaptin-like subunit of the clathrin associated protein complex (AP-3), putative; Apl5p [Cryptococcus gattii WM276]KIR78637.1 AP-3 complex subunit delta-1 [Cryptococcus gattii EJB2]KIY34588.1 AP-3 complex subunit delta-1 [Cryptococcus gattii E566]